MVSREHIRGVEIAVDDQGEGAALVLANPDEMQALAAAIPRALHRAIPAAGHLSPWEAPEAFAAAVLEFARTLPLPSPPPASRRSAQP